MTSISKLYPILKKTGLNDPDIQGFIEIIEDSVLKGLTTKEDLKGTESELKENIKDTESKLKENIRDTESELKENIKDTESKLKENIRDTESKLKENIRDTEIRLNQKLHDTEVRLIKWVIGLLIAQTSIIIAIIKLF